MTIEYSDDKNGAKTYLTHLYTHNKQNFKTENEPALLV
jgi:hypothetical protein